MHSSVTFFALALAALPAALAQVQPWGQCAGFNETPKACTSGYYCFKQNDWYSQCIPGNAPGNGGQPQQPTTTAQPVITTPTTAPNPGATSTAVPNPGTGAGSAGCGKSPLAAGNRNINVNGRQRSYILTLPPNYNPNKAYNLIFGFHWLNGGASDVGHNRNDQHYGLYALAQGSTIFVAPQGLNAGWANSNGDDIRLFDAILAEIETNLCIDSKKVFANGFSYGGAMSYSVACSRPNKIAGIAIYAGALLSGCDGGTQPVPYFHAHGIHDNVLSISMGRQIRDTFVRNNGCTAQTTREPSGGSNQWVKTEYQGCRPGYPVTWIAFDDGHTATPRGNGNMAQEVWSFFSKFM